ncbi:unnamed protein product, partial [Polarella glacialis]
GGSCVLLQQIADGVSCFSSQSDCKLKVGEAHPRRLGTEGLSIADRAAAAGHAAAEVAKKKGLSVEQQALLAGAAANAAGLNNNLPVAETAAFAGKAAAAAAAENGLSKVEQAQAAGISAAAAGAAAKLPAWEAASLAGAAAAANSADAGCGGRKSWRGRKPTHTKRRTYMLDSTTELPWQLTVHQVLDTGVGQRSFLWRGALPGARRRVLRGVALRGIRGPV